MGSWRCGGDDDGGDGCGDGDGTMVMVMVMGKYPNLIKALLVGICSTI